MGRPKGSVKYKERRKLINFFIDEEFIDRLDAIADSKNLTRTEFIYILLKQADKEEALKIANALCELRKQNEQLSRENKDNYEKYIKEVRKASDNMLGIKITPTKTAEEAFEMLKNNFFIVKEKNKNNISFPEEKELNRWIEAGWIIMQKIAADENIVLEKEKRAKMMMRILFLRASGKKAGDINANEKGIA